MGSSRESDFSLDHYRRILTRIKATHQTLSFREVAAFGVSLFSLPRFVIMRHDVEFSLAAAERMAEIDAACEVNSTFFLLQTGDYNCFEEAGARSIKRILSLGHDIGLHYDGGLFERLGVEPMAAAARQIAMFETFFSAKVSAMSAHMPARSGITFAVPGVINVYDPLYFQDVKYISDSLQAWREGVVTDLLDRHDRIHLLTHECNWSEDGLGWDTIMLQDADAKRDALRTRAIENIKLFQEGLATRSTRDALFKQRIASSAG